MNVNVMDTQTGGEGDTIQLAKPPVKVTPPPKVTANPAQEVMTSAVEMNRFVQPTEPVVDEKTQPVSKVPNTEYWQKVYDWVSKNPKLETERDFNGFVKEYSSDPIKTAKLYSAIQKTSTEYPRNFEIGSLEEFQQYTVKPFEVPSAKDMVNSLIKTAPESVTVPPVKFPLLSPEFEKRTASPRPAYSTTTLAFDNLQKKAAGEDISDMAVAASMQKLNTAMPMMSNPFYKKADNAELGAKLTEDIKGNAVKQDELNKVDNQLLKNSLGEDLGYTTGAERNEMDKDKYFDPAALLEATEKIQVTELNKQHKIEDDALHYENDFKVYDEIVKNKDWKKGAELVFALEGVPKGMSLLEMKAEVMDNYNFIKKQHETTKSRLENYNNKKSATPEMAAQIQDDIEDSELYDDVKFAWEEAKNYKEGNKFATSYDKRIGRLINDGYVTADGKKVKATIEEIDVIENYLIGQEEKKNRTDNYWKNPKSIATYEGYYEAIDQRAKSMERGIGEHVKTLNKVIVGKTEKKIADLTTKIQEEYNRDVEFYNGKITEQFASAYEEAFTNTPQAQEIRKMYSDMMVKAKTDEEKLGIEAKYNDELSKLPLFSQVAAEQKKAADEINLAISAKYDNKVRTENRKITDAAHDEYLGSLREYARKNFSFNINKDKGVLEFTNEVTNSVAFNSATYSDKKDMLATSWNRYKSTLSRDLYGKYIRVPEKGQEELPWYKWTGKKEKSKEQMAADYASAKKRLGAQAEREFYLDAMDKVMFSSKKQEATAFQMKSYAEQMVEDLDEQIDNLKKAYPNLSSKSAITFAAEPTQFNAASKISSLMLAKDKFNEIVNHKETDDGFFKDLGDELYGGKFYEYIPFVSTIMDINHGYSAYKASRKVQDGKALTYVEKVALESMAGLKKIEELKPSSRGTKVGGFIKAMPAFVGEFVSTGGAFRVGSTAAKGAFKMALKNKLKTEAGEKVALELAGAEIATGQWKPALAKLVDETFEGGVSKHMASSLELVVGSLAQTTANPQLVIKNIIDRMTPEVTMFLGGHAEDVHALVASKSMNEDFGEAFLKGGGLAWAEMFTEHLGGAVFKMPKGVLPKIVNDTEWLQRSILGGWYRAHKFVSKSEAIQYIVKNNMSWSGIIPEYFEEFTNGRLGALITGDKEVWDIDAEEELVTFLSTSIFGAGMGIAQTAPRVVKSVLNDKNEVSLTVEQTNYQTNKPETATISINRQAWKKFNGSILGGNGLNFKELKNFLGSDNFTPAQKEVLTGIYNQVKAKEIKNSPQYDAAVKEFEEESGVKVADNWNSKEGAVIPTVEGSDMDESAISSEESKRVVLPHDEFVGAALENGFTNSFAKRMTSGFTAKDGTVYLSERFSSRDSVAGSPVELAKDAQVGDKQIVKDPETNLVTETEVVNVNGDEVVVRDNRTGETVTQTKTEHAQSKANSEDKANMANLNWAIEKRNTSPESVSVPWNKKNYTVTFDEAGNVAEIKEPDGTKADFSPSSMKGITARAVEARAKGKSAKPVVETPEPLSQLEQKELDHLTVKQQEYEVEQRDLPVADQQRLFELSERAVPIKPTAQKTTTTAKPEKQKPVAEKNEVKKVEKIAPTKFGWNTLSKQSDEVLDKKLADVTKELDTTTSDDEVPLLKAQKKTLESEISSRKKTASKQSSPAFNKFKEVTDSVGELKGVNFAKATMVGDEFFDDAIRKEHADGKITDDEFNYLDLKHKLATDEWVRLNPKGVKSIDEHAQKLGGTAIVGTQKKPKLQVQGTGRLNALLGNIAKRLGKAFPNIKVVTQWEDFLQAAVNLGFTPTMAKDLMGMYHDGTVYLNPNKAGANTAMEEFAHLWIQIAKEVDQETYYRGLQMARKTKYFDDVKNDPAYSGYSFEERKDEALAKAIADRGESIINSELNANLYTKFKTFLKDFWNGIKKALGLKGNKSLRINSTTLDEFATTVAKELLSEMPISAISTQDIYDMAHNNIEPEIKISNSVLAPRNWVDSVNSWKRYWFEENKGAGKEIPLAIRKARGQIDRELKDAQRTVVEFNAAVEAHLDDAVGKMTKAEWVSAKTGRTVKKAEDRKKEAERVLGIVDVFLKQGQAFNTKDIPDLLLIPARKMRSAIDNLQTKLKDALKDWGMLEAGSELEATLNKNHGIWIHRSYMMYDVPNYHKVYDKILTPKQLNDAEKMIRGMAENKNIKSVTWETTPNGTRVIRFENKNAMFSAEISEDETDIHNLLKTLIPEEANDVYSAIGKSKEGVMDFKNETNTQDVIRFKLTSQNMQALMKSILLTAGTQGELIGGVGKAGTGKFEASVLKKRGELDEVITAFMGEYTDPRINFVKSVAKITQLLEKGKMESELLKQAEEGNEKGQGSFLRKNRSIPQGGEGMTLSVKIEPKDSFLLNGYWTTPEVYDVLYRRRSSASESQYRGVQFLAMLNGVAKMNMTVTKMDSQARNFWGAALNLMATGHLPTGLINAVLTANRDFTAGQKAASFISAPLFVTMMGAEVWLLSNKNKTDKRQAFQEAYLDAVKYNLIEQSVEAGILKEMADKLYTDAVVGSVWMRAQIKTNQGYKAALDLFGKPYQASDAIFKIIQWEKEKKAFTKAYANRLKSGQMTQEEFDDFVKLRAAETVRAEQPTYSSSNEAIKFIAKEVPFVAPFIMWPAQIWKTRRAIIRNTRDLLIEANAATDKTEKSVLRAMAMKRIAGMLFTTSLTPALMYASLWALGWTGDDDEAFRKMKLGYDENSPIVYLGGTKKKPITFDMSFIDPMSMFHKMGLALLRGDTGYKKLTGFLKEAADPLISPELGAKVLFEAISGEDQYGQEIVNSEEDYQFFKKLYHLTDVFVPGFYHNMENIGKGAVGFKTDVGYTYSFWEEVINTEGGVKAKTKEMDKMFRSRIGADWKGINKAKEIYGRKRLSGEISQSEKNELFEDANVYAKRRFVAMRAKYEAMKQLGFTDNEIYNLMAVKDLKGTAIKPESFISKYMIQQIINNEFKGIDKGTGNFIGSEGSGNKGMSFGSSDLNLDLNLDLDLKVK